MSIDFVQVEDKVIAELKANMKYLKNVESYAGQLASEIDKLVGNFPAVYVAYGGSKLEWVDGTVYNDLPDFDIIVVSKNFKGGEARRKDTNGCYDMIKDVLKYLTNQDFGMDIEKLKPVDVTLLLSTHLATAYNIKFQTNFDIVYE
ncbi:MAG: DUF1834 family protein [Thermodesulfovibrionia bacterium]|nr:DUF1834 family protein [Thermodesulfovibrionia bacterium]